MSELFVHLSYIREDGTFIEESVKCGELGRERLVCDALGEAGRRDAIDAIIARMAVPFRHRIDPWKRAYSNLKHVR